MQTFFSACVSLMERILSKKLPCLTKILPNKKHTPQVIAKNNNLEKRSFDYQVSKYGTVI